MRPYLYAMDDVLEPYEFGLLQDYTRRLEYVDRDGPDGATYPGISDQVPEAAIERLTYALSWVAGYRVVIKICAFRLSVEGTVPPQWAHSDLEVARFASFLHINPTPSATVLLRHRETGMVEHPSTEEEVEILRRDQNDEGAWDIIGGIYCRPNRLAVLQAGLIHAALPRLGYGTNAENGRLILWTFFD